MIDLTGRTDVLVPEEVLSELSSACRELGLEFLVVGAAARDLIIHARQQSNPERETDDVDIAVAVRAEGQFSDLIRRFPLVRGHQNKITVHDVEVDVVPFGDIEQARTILFPDDHRLDVNGLQEAHATAVSVRMPNGTEIRAAGAPAQTALKILAWRDRHEANTKDGIDLRVILLSLSADPFVNEVWGDDVALDATDADIITAAAFHYARIAAEPFTVHDGMAVVDVLHDTTLRALLTRDMRSNLLAPSLLDAYAKGFLTGLRC
ncbi:hypothetical protein [Flexivirga caeni]|uniref:Nucleotidyltransferase n=1 Tax=Flexivirga caeni TaxID=2294115 RepID=A0A3M9M6U1_9MICO|nr:hypothetical protein [Flexivirga caeni]RNI20895.1 hypothetical protein EFY87_13415 [Flexivirga caeni]